jgi:hypothetical protein
MLLSAASVSAFFFYSAAAFLEIFFSLRSFFTRGGILGFFCC